MKLDWGDSMKELISQITFTDWLGTIGAVISILCSIFSFIIYLKNKGIRNRIIKNQEIGEYATFLEKTSKIVDAINKSVNISIKSKIHERLINNLFKYLEQLKLIEGHLKRDNKVLVKDNVSYIEETIRKLSDNENKMEEKQIRDIPFKILEIQTQINDSFKNKKNEK
jgi:hypothetical protein